MYRTPQTGACTCKKGRMTFFNNQPKREFAVFDKSENVFSSIVKDFFSFATICLCVYVSRGSNWWTFFTGVFLILFVFAKFNYIVKTRHHTFRSKKELIEWANSLEDDAK